MNEEQIRPEKIFNEYLRLCEIDCLDFFSSSKKEEINCPACNNPGDHSFNKNDFNYKVCNSCETLYVSPRPIESAFNKYYLESQSVRYWATTFYKETAEARRKKIWKPKAKMILELIQRYNLSKHSVVDIGAGYGIFCEEFSRISNISITAIEPGPELAKICQNKDIPVINKFLQDILLEELDGSPKVFVSFELFEHLHSPENFLTYLFNLMQKGDFFIFTTLSSLGVDIRALWENSKSVSPPHHLNFMNPHSIKILLNKIGLNVLDVSTPGVLDLDILLNNQDLIKDNFWKTFIKYSNQAQRSEWQAIISKSGYSSHMMICCQKC